jgi:hypothetical protein
MSVPGRTHLISEMLQQFQIQNLMPLKALHQENLTIINNFGDR